MEKTIKKLKTFIAGKVGQGLLTVDDAKSARGPPRTVHPNYGRRGSHLCKSRQREEIEEAPGGKGSRDDHVPASHLVLLLVECEGGGV